MSSVNMPNPVTPPPSPTEDPAAIKQRQIASDNAIAEAKSTGRGSTIVGGGVIARDEQMKRARARAASSDLGL
jgi:hypothetical protein